VRPNEVICGRSPSISPGISAVSSALTGTCREGRECVVGCKVHSRSGYYRVQAASETFGKSIDAALEKLVRQRRRRKSIGQTARRVESARALEEPRMQ